MCESIPAMLSGESSGSESKCARLKDCQVFCEHVWLLMSSEKSGDLLASWKLCNSLEESEECNT